MRAQVWASIRMILVLTLLTGILYPLAVFGIGQVAWKSQSNGSALTVNGKVVGSKLLGQSFSSPKYFHPRPSAAGDGYDATASAGSNLGPTNPDLLAKVSDLTDQYRKENGLSKSAKVPVDAVTASSSGLDPDISPANAYLQAARVAKERGISTSAVYRLIDDRTHDRSLGILGEKSVNVLLLNIDLDNLKK